MLTPYQFASNRPIDGIDLDGLEYATFTINYNKAGNVTKISVAKDYELKNKYSKGAGILYMCGFKRFYKFQFSYKYLWYIARW